MNKPINKLFSLRLLLCTMFSHSTMRTLCIGVLLFNIGAPVAAAQANCGKERMAVTQAFSAHLPANPHFVKNALLLRREGEVLCQQGDTESGRAKLNKAAALLKPDSVAADLSNQKGESHE